MKELLANYSKQADQTLPDISKQVEKISCFIPRVECPDTLLLSNLEEGMEHAPVAHLCVLGLTLDL